MIQTYQAILASTSKDEALAVVSKMGMNTTDHPYRSKERRKELKDEEQKQSEEYENKRKEKTSDNQTIGK